jgi:hypothetical protein
MYDVHRKCFTLKTLLTISSIMKGGTFSPPAVIRISCNYKDRCFCLTIVLPYTKTKMLQMVDSSVAADPHVFGPPGSGSIIQKYVSGSFYHQAKIVRKTLIPIIL